MNNVFKLEDIRELLLTVAHEAHAMGRIYNKLGEPEKPSEVCEMIRKMIAQKVVQFGHPDIEDIAGETGL